MMSICKIISTLNRLTLSNPLQSPIFYRGISTNKILQFQITPILLAEPLKKKKRIDPAVIKHREDRKKRKIEKQIRKLERNAKQLKPIEECEVPLCLLNERLLRQRNIKVPDEIAEQRILLEKKWSFYKQQKHLEDIQMLDNLMFAKQKALDELQKESEELYQAAIQFDENLLPYNTEGPKETPPTEEYYAPDGDTTDVSKVW